MSTKNPEFVCRVTAIGFNARANI